MTSNPAEFWDRRHDITLSAVAGTRGGDKNYRLALLVDITDPEVITKCRRVVEDLDRFDCFDTAASEMYHLTIKMFDVGVEPSTNGIIDPRTTVQQIDTVVSDAISACDPFAVDFTQFNIFPDIVYGEVEDNGQLAEMNRVICDHDGITTLDRDRDQFIPHLTFGYFRGEGDCQALVEFIEANRELQFPTVLIEQVTLVAYDVGDHQPTYNHIKTYEL
jgi:hypothetical protein